MIHLYSLFDYNNYPHKIIYTAFIKGGKVWTLPMYHPKNDNLYKIEKNRRLLKQLIRKSEIILNDFKSHIVALDLPKEDNYMVYESNMPKLKSFPKVLPSAKKLCVQLLAASKKIEPDLWRQILANSQLVYQHLEDNKVVQGNKVAEPIYGFVYTGRSKTQNFNIQGYTEGDLFHSNLNYDYFIHIDWMSADLRAAALLSKDEKLAGSFKTSDSYTIVVKDLNESLEEDEEPVERNDIKLNFLQSIYSLDADGPVLQYYPTFQKWMKIKLKELEAHNKLQTILGREFKISEKRDTKSVFNSIFQGSVAHAMQIVLYRIFKLFPNNLLAETHDAVVLAAERASIPSIVSEVGGIMVEPFKGLIEGEHRFPIRISIGHKWREWKLFKVCR